MDNLLTRISIQVNDKIYLKDPQSSELGKKILSGSIDLIDDLGFEQFTFKKLAEAIGSTEASIYRYFENKHKLLLYLTSWYWSWLEYRMVFSTANIDSAYDRLERALELITEKVQADSSVLHINEAKLSSIVFNESSKGYLIKDVDQENKEGVYLDYKQLVARISDIILEIKPKFKYPHMLISTVIEGAHLQRFFAEHLPRLTDTDKNGDAVTTFYKNMVFNMIKAA